MASKRRPYWRTLGTPTSLVLYRNPDGWRYAVHFTGPAGIADALAGPPPSSEPDIAQGGTHPPPARRPLARTRST